MAWGVSGCGWLGFGIQLAIAEAPAAIDLENLAGDKGCGIGEEQHGGGVEILWGCDASSVERLFGSDKVLDGRVLGGALGHGGIDEAWGDGVDADQIGGVAGGAAAGEAYDACLGGGVGMGGEVFWRGGRGEHAGEVQDDSGLFVIEPELDGGTVREKDGGKVEIEGFLPGLIGERMERAIAPGASRASGNVVEAVEVSVLFDCGLDRIGGGVGLGGIGGDDLGVGPQGGGCDGDVFVRSSDRDDMGSCSDDCFGGGEADA